MEGGGKVKTYRLASVEHGPFAPRHLPGIRQPCRQVGVPYDQRQDGRFEGGGIDDDGEQTSRQNPADVHGCNKPKTAVLGYFCGRIEQEGTQEVNEGEGENLNTALICIYTTGQDRVVVCC